MLKQPTKHKKEFKKKKNKKNDDNLKMLMTMTTIKKQGRLTKSPV